MSDITTAVDAIRKQARLYEPLVKVADELEKIGSLDNARKEHEASIASLSAEKAKLSKEVKGLKDKLNDGLAEIKDAIDAEKSRSIAECSVIKAEADKALAKAKEKAKRIIDDATAKGDAIVVRANAELLSLNEQASNAQLEIKEAIAQQEAAQLELDNINKKIEAAKAKVSALLS